MDKKQHAPKHKPHWGQAGLRHLGLGKGAVALATLATVGVGTPSCKKSVDTIDKVTYDTVKTTDHVKFGQLGLYYDKAEGNQSVINSLNQYKFAVVEPSYTPASLNIKNAAAYASIGGINQQNSGADLRALSDAIDAKNGFLRDANGNIQTRPGDASINMVDPRKADAYALMKEYFFSLLQATPKGYNKGVFLDELDYVVYLETSVDPTRYKGLIDKTLQLMQEVAAEAQRLGKVAIINGGVQQPYNAETGDEKVLRAIFNLPASEIVLAKESLYRDGKGNPWTGYDSTWLESRVMEAAKASKAAGRTGFRMLGIEPVFKGVQASDIHDVSLFYNKLFSNVEAATGQKVEADLFLCNPSHANPQDLIDNLHYLGTPGATFGLANPSTTVHYSSAMSSSVTSNAAVQENAATPQSQAPKHPWIETSNLHAGVTIHRLKEKQAIAKSDNNSEDRLASTTPRDAAKQARFVKRAHGSYARERLAEKQAAEGASAQI